MFMFKWRPVVELTIEECEAEAEHLERFFEECAEAEHGISTKDAVRHRLCRERIAAHKERTS